MTTHVRTPQLADWALSRGRSAFTTEELAVALGVAQSQVPQRMAVPARRGEWVSPARGLWVPVPSEFREWGAPPGIEVIDLLATHLDVDYYVGWLSAAELHGAAHQAPQAFQVAVSRQVRDRRVGRTRFEFHQRGDVAEAAVTAHETRSGSARVSTPEQTALDLAADVGAAGGIDNAATVIVELAEQENFDIDVLADLAQRHPVAVARRVGWILDRFSPIERLHALRMVAQSGPATPARLDPRADLVGPLDHDWVVRVNREPEPDL